MHQLQGLGRDRVLVTSCRPDAVPRRCCAPAGGYDPQQSGREGIIGTLRGHALPFAVLVAPDDHVRAQFSGLFDGADLIAAVDHAHSSVAEGQRSSAGPAQSSEKVSTRVVWEAQNAKPMLSVRLDIAQDWHVNANPASLDFLIPTQVSVGVNGKSLAFAVTYPAGKDGGIRLNGKIIHVYDNGTIIKLGPNSEALPALRKSGKITINTRIQACSNSGICLAPSTLHDQLVVH